MRLACCERACIKLSAILVRFGELSLRRKDRTKVGWAPMNRVEKILEHPWCLCIGALQILEILHKKRKTLVSKQCTSSSGVVDVARRHGCDIHINSQVASISHQTPNPVLVEIESGASFSFDPLIGSYEVGSIVRRALFPSVKPSPPPTNYAYRAVIPYSQIRKDPFLTGIVSKPTIEVWMAPHAYIITYPISAGKDFNMVHSHHHPNPVPAP